MEDIYLSCPWLEGGFSFGINCINVCCISHSGDKGTPFLCDYDGGDFPYEHVISTKNGIIKKLNNDELTPCTGCQYLNKRKWDKLFFPFNMIAINHFIECNLRCNYCYSSNPIYTIGVSEKPYILKDAFDTIISENLLDPSSIVIWGGGEPTIYPEFTEILKLSAQYNIKTQIFTNCTTRLVIIEDYLKKGIINRIVCSVDAGNRETYIKVKGKDRYDIVWENIAQYIKISSSESVIVKYIFLDENKSKNDIEMFIDVCKNNNVKYITIEANFYDYDCYNGDIPDDLIDKMSYMAFLAMINGIHYNVGNYIGNSSYLRIKFKSIEYCFVNEISLTKQIFDEIYKTFFPSAYELLKQGEKVSSLAEWIDNRDHYIKNLSYLKKQLKEKEIFINSQNKMIVDKENFINSQNKMIREKENFIKYQNIMVQEKEWETIKLNNFIKRIRTRRRSRIIRFFWSLIPNKYMNIYNILEKKNLVIKEYEEKVNRLKNTSKILKRNIKNIHNQLRNKEKFIKQQNYMILEKEEKIIEQHKIIGSIKR